MQKQANFTEKFQATWIKGRITVQASTKRLQQTLFLQIKIVTVMIKSDAATLLFLQTKITVLFLQQAQFLQDSKVTSHDAVAHLTTAENLKATRKQPSGGRGGPLEHIRKA
jgi:hypothetical protein